ncbi:MAG: SpoIIE family protein phosphatase [Phycisphaeraceae bacterium]|nr:SpoIIE family protein phosphatase [Phycisphaeraceae bacterium]
MTSPAVPSPAASAAPKAPTAAGTGAAPALSIADFITDASLPAACDHLTKLTGVEVSLRDPEGRKIVRREPPPAWEFDLSAPPVGPESVSIPLLVDGRAIGSIVLGPGTPRVPEKEGRARLIEALAQIAKTAAEFCRQDVDLRHRVKEVQALYRLSSMLVRATKAEAVLDIALESALDALELDAGSIVLFEQEEGPTTQTEVDLVLKASRNLSREWLESPLPLSKERLFDRLALEGQVVTSHDLLTDDRVLIHDHVRSEGLRSAMHAGLVFQDRAIGVIRLYARRPREFTESEKRLLKSIAAQAAVAVEQARLLKMQEREQRVQRQVQLAVDVQRRMLPRKVPSLARLDVAARYVPSFELGGDFYDFFELAGSFGIAIGDVVGKGLAAALLMASVRASLRAHVQDVYHIDDVLSRVNAALVRDTLDNEFATLWYGVIDTEKLRLTYCAGGHEPPMVFRAVQGRTPTLADIDELSIGGMAVGIDPSQRYQRGTYDLHAGDVLIAYTDGVTDTLNFSGKKFGKQRLRQAVLRLLSEEPGASAARIADHIYWELRQYAGILERPDDQTVVVVRVK